MKNQYDYIIVDTPPLGLINDALILVKYSDVNILVTRHNYTHKKVLSDIINMLTSKKIPNINIIINDIEITSNKYGYGKGYQHLHDVFREALVRADRLVRLGKNVIFLAHNWPIKTTHPESEDFLMEAPQLSNRNPSNVAQIVAWASHVFRIGHTDIVVEDNEYEFDGELDELDNEF